MLRNHKRSAVCTWSNAQLEAAVADVKAGKAGVCAAARKYGIPCSSLHDHLSGKTSKRHRGHQTVLTPTLEKEIITACIVLQEIGFPLTKELVGAIVRDHLEDIGQASPFTNGILGRDWWTYFLGRWPVLSEHRPQHLQRARAACVTPEVRI